MPLGRTSGLFPVQLYRVGPKSDRFTFAIAKTGEKRYEYGPFNREGTKRYLRELDARIYGLAWIPAILDATKGKRKAWVKCDASILAKIWRGTNPSKKYAYWADRLGDAGYPYYLEELMVDNQLTPEDAVEMVETWANEVMHENPDIQIHRHPEHLRHRVKTHLESKDALQYVEDVVAMILYKTESVKTENLIDLVLQGVDPNRIVASIAEEKDYGLPVGSRVEITRELLVTAPYVPESDDIRKTAGRSYLRSGSMGSIAEITQDSVTVSFDAGYVETFSKDHYRHYFASTLISESSVRIGDRISIDGASWEVSGLDYTSNRALLIDPFDAEDPLHIDLDEIKNNLANGRWKLVYESRDS